MTEKKIIELLKTGDFTIAYHDNGQCSLYKGKFEYDDLPEKSLHDFDYNDAEGYCPHIVVLLAKALCGKSETI
jgi:hypothetical protein